MKHLILLLSLSFFCLCLRAQTNIKMGTPYPAIEDGYRAYIPYNNQVLALKSTKKVTTFYRIDPKTLSTTLIGEFKLPKNIHNLERVMELGGKHYAFYTLYEKKSQTLALYAGEIDLDKGKFVDNLKFVYKTEGYYYSPNTYRSNKHVTELKGAHAIALWDFKVSHDKEKLLITKYHYTDSNFLFALFDKDLHQLWTRTVGKLPSNLNTKKVTLKVTDYNVDADENIYLSTLAYSSSAFNTRYQVELCKVSPSGKVSLIPVEIGERIPRKIWLEEGINKQLKCIIAYSENSKEYLINGLLVGDISEGEITNISSKECKPSFYDFVNKVGNQFYSVATYTCNLEKVIKEKDGTLIYLFEFQHTDVEHDLINLKDNLLMKVDPNGAINWINALPKNHQKSFKIAESKYKYFRGENNHYVLFMDALKSSKSYDLSVYAKKYKTNTPGVLAYYKINHNSGKITKHQILETDISKEKKLSRLYMNKISQIEDSKLVLEAFLNKKTEVVIEIDFQ